MTAPFSYRQRLLRLWRHLWQTESDRVVSDAQLQRLQHAVHHSEQAHRGEVRICIDTALPWSEAWSLRHPHALQRALRARAVHWFAHLHIWDTADNTGVLIHLLLAERHIEIVADRGLRAHIQAAQWERVVQDLAVHLRKGDFEAGLQAALADVTHLLQVHVPVDTELPNANELPDTVVRV